MVQMYKQIDLPERCFAVSFSSTKLTLFLISLLMLLLNSCTKTADYNTTLLDGACFMNDSTILFTTWEFVANKQTGSFPDENATSEKDHSYNIYRYSLISETLIRVFEQKQPFSYYDKSGGNLVSHIFYRAPYLYYSIYNTNDHQYDFRRYNFTENSTEAVLDDIAIEWLSDDEKFGIGFRTEYSGYLHRSKDVTVTIDSGDETALEFTPFYIGENKAYCYVPKDNFQYIVQYNFEDMSCDTLRSYDPLNDRLFYSNTTNVIRKSESRYMQSEKISDYIAGTYGTSVLSKQPATNRIYDFIDYSSGLLQRNGNNLYYIKPLQAIDESLVITPIFEEKKK